eukprot:symbB.v1.2.001223.t2/scaffold66.1/size357995/26
MINALVQKLNLPSSFFYDLDLQFSQFDFDGDGTLNREETSCMVKSILKERRASAGGKPEDCDVLVPYKTLQDGGYVVVRELGRGGQGVMYLGKKETQRNWFTCRQNDDDTEYCIKFYYKKDSNAGSIHEIVDEFSRMKDFDNEHVARTFETFQDQDFYYLVNEPYFGGDWTKLACKAYESGVHMTEDWWRNLYSQCLHGLDYLHRKAQMHCDIKEPNLMVKGKNDYRRPEVVYIDFGLSQAFARKVENVTGTPGYIPPETWQEKAWYPSGDIFSLGVGLSMDHDHGIRFDFSEAFAPESLSQRLRRLADIAEVDGLEADARREIDRLPNFNVLVVGHFERPLCRTDFPFGCPGAGDVVVIEIPHRMNGGKCISWKDLQEIAQLTKATNARLHMDGARLCEALPHFQEQEVARETLCGLFDSIYMSWYKGFGGMNGALLATSKSLISSALDWKARLGGRVFTQAPHWIDARRQFETLAGSFQRRYSKLCELVQAMSTEPIIKQILRFEPPIPQSCMVHIYLKGAEHEVVAAHEELMTSRGLKLWNRLRGPGYGLHFADSKSTEPTEIEGQEVYFEFNMGPANAQIPISVYIEGWTAMAAILLGNKSPLVVFFQMLSGRVPSEDGSIRGIFQEGADFMQLAKYTAEASPPWHQFPTQWGELSRVVASMLQKQKEHRPRAVALLRDPWFQSHSAASLPAENLAAIVHRSKEAVSRSCPASDFVNELCETCNLQELRKLQERLDELRQFGQAPQNPTVGTAKFLEVVSAYGASPVVLQNFATYVAKGPTVNYVNLLKEVIEEKEKRSNQLVTNLFNEMDRNGDGHLSYNELRAMLESDAFDCGYEDVEEVLDNMDENQDGYVDFEEMKRAIMEDGRIAMKDEADRGERPGWGFLGLF